MEAIAISGRKARLGVEETPDVGPGNSRAEPDVEVVMWKSLGEDGGGGGCDQAQHKEPVHLHHETRLLENRFPNEQLFRLVRVTLGSRVRVTASLCWRNVRNGDFMVISIRVRRAAVSAGTLAAGVISILALSAG